MPFKPVIVAIVILLTCSMLLCIPSISASSGQIYWGAWVGDSHLGNYNLLTTFESQVGKGVSIWNWIQLWNRPQDSENMPSFDVLLMDQARNHGAIPMVSWGPEVGNANFPYTNLDSIIDGSQDAYFIAWGHASAQWGHPYLVRLMWEFTGSWTDANGIYPWGSGNTPAKFVQAWQHVVNTVRNAGGTQISWVWCPGDVGDSVATLHSVYPGDSYIDWVGTDIYGNLNQGDVELTNIHTAVPQKSVMIPEIGYSGRNCAYWSTLLTTTLPNQYPYVKAVVIWEMPSGGLTVVNSGTLSAFKSAIASSYYSSNTFSVESGNQILPLDSIPPTPTPTPIVSPTPTPTPHSGGLSISDIAIIVVMAVIGFVGYTQYVKQPKKKHKS